VRVGIPREIKNHEYRVAVTPAGVHELVSHGHEVVIEAGAGVGSSIPDLDFVAAGAQMCASAEAVWESADMILKVKEPIAAEYGSMREGQIIFTYLHLAASQECTDALVKSGATAIAYETVELTDGSLPLLAPMSEVAGRLVRQVDAIYQGHMQTVTSNSFEIERAVLEADMVIGAVLVPGTKAPKLVSNDLVSRMKPGSVLVDIAVDQGGCFEDSRPTTHADPTYQVHQSVFYCVANMPGAVPHTSTYALTNVTLPYAVALANKGWKKALSDDPALALGLNVHNRCVTYGAVAESWSYPLTELSEALV
jgi:alanine dehydrogenase